MKEIGFPSPFIDIMMFRPASRTSAICAWKSSSARTTLREAEIGYQALKPCELVAADLPCRKYDDQELRLADHHAVNRVAEDRNAAAESIIVRSTNTASGSNHE